MKDKKPTVVKKVSPYPFEVTLQIAGRPMVVQALKLTLKGMLAELKSNVVKVGEEGQAQFVTPVLKDIISANVKVVRTYDQFKQIKETRSHEVIRMAEFMFIALPEASKFGISKFVSAIGQGE